MMRKIVHNLIIVLMMLSMVGCSVSNILPETRGETSYPETEEELGMSAQPSMPSKGGRLRIPISKPESINPLFTKSKDFINLCGLIYEGMFAYDENLNVVPVLVESWEVLDEGKLWQFQLRKGVRWHNGKELTAHDVKYTFDLLLNERQQVEQGGDGSIYVKKLFSGRDIARMEFVINNPYGIAIVLNDPAGRTLMEALTFPILPAPVEDGQGSPNIDDVESLIGTGPFKVESGDMEIGGQIKLVRNDAWWGNPKPYIDSIVANIYRDNEESLEAFRKGLVDLVDTHVIYAESYRVNNQAQLYRYLTYNFDYIGINHKKPGVLGDPKVREAIAYAMDRKDIISRVYFSSAQAVDVPIPSDAWYYNSDLRVYDYQPIKAQQLLEEAGWRDSNQDGILDMGEGDETTDLSFTINVNMDNVMKKESMNIIAKQLKEVGIDVKINLLPWEEYVKALEEGDFQAVLAEHSLGLPIDLRFMLHSSEIGNGLNNYVGYNNQDLDELLDKVGQIQDPQEFLDTYKQIQRHMIEELPIISLYYRTSSLVASHRVQGIKAPRELMIYRGINEWYLDR